MSNRTEDRWTRLPAVLPIEEQVYPKKEERKTSHAKIRFFGKPAELQPVDDVDEGDDE